MAASLWAILLWCAAAAGFLITRPLFHSWPDQGYGVAKVTGPFLVGAVAWGLAGLGPFPWGHHTSIAALALLGGVAGAITWRTGYALPSSRLLLRIDAVWLACFTGFALLRATHPSIIGAERPMDHALLAALMRQSVIPITDPWFAGATVNYHHVGHALWASLGHLSAMTPALVYNLALATLPAQVVTAAWSVGRRLWASTSVPAGGALWGAAMLVCAAPLGALAAISETWTSPRTMSATRVIAGTINEFPFFSFIWGDLHGHVLALPLLVALAATLVRLDELTRRAREADAAAVVGVAALAAAIAVASVLASSWDAVPVLLAAGWTLLLLANVRRRTAIAAMAAALCVAILMAWPALTSFRPPSVAAGWEWDGTSPGAFLRVQSTWLLPAVLVLVHRGRLVTLASIAAALVGVGWAAPSFVVRAGLVALGAALWPHRAALGRPTTGLLVTAIALLVIAECVWMDDVYGWDLRRMNTVFKWHLHAIVLLACALPGVLTTLVSMPGRIGRRTTWSAMAALALVSFTYPVVAAVSQVRHREPTFTLDGLAGMRQSHPGDAAAVQYLWTEATGSDVVLEAAGRSYSYGSRISALTGQPTLLGWRGHEELWRRGEEWHRRIAARAQLVDDLYAGPVAALTSRLRAAEVRYVVVGPVERRTYPALTADRFTGSARVVSNTNGTVLLRVE